MSLSALNQILACMPLHNAHPSIQRVQTAHRIKIAESWNIQSGSKILEIGCGQGDMTAVLAYLVGPDGWVQGIDIASPDYGSPVTVGESAAGIMASELGSRIHMTYNCDLLSLSPDQLIALGRYDYIILSQSSWYLDQQETLLKLFQIARTLGSKICYADWDLRLTSMEQMPHFLTALIQGQIECFKAESHANIRTLFTPQKVKQLLNHSGWQICHETSLCSEDLQDPHWEIQSLQVNAELEMATSNTMPDKLKQLIRSELTLLESVMATQEIKPLATYIVTAE